MDHRVGSGSILADLLGTFMTRSSQLCVQLYGVGSAFLIFLGLSLCASVVLMATRLIGLPFRKIELKVRSRELSFY